MEEENKIRDFLHDLSNDLTVVEGFVKVCLSPKRTPEQKEEYLNKGIEKLKNLSQKVRDFKSDYS